MALVFSLSNPIIGALGVFLVIGFNSLETHSVSRDSILTRDRKAGGCRTGKIALSNNSCPLRVIFSISYFQLSYDPPASDGRKLNAISNVARVWCTAENRIGSMKMGTPRSRCRYSVGEQHIRALLANWPLIHEEYSSSIQTRRQFRQVAILHRSGRIHCSFAASSLD